MQEVSEEKLVSIATLTGSAAVLTTLAVVCAGSFPAFFRADSTALAAVATSDPADQALLDSVNTVASQLTSPATEPVAVRAAASSTPRGSVVPLYRHRLEVEKYQVHIDLPLVKYGNWKNDTMLGYIAVAPEPGLVPLYQCVFNYGTHDQQAPFTSRNANCNGKEVRGIIGYAWPTPAPDRIALYSCVQSILTQYCKYGYFCETVRFVDFRTSKDPKCGGGDEVRYGGEPYAYLKTSTSTTINLSITATPREVKLGATSTIAWAATNATSCTVTKNDAAFGKGFNGTKSSGVLTATTTFMYTCAKAGMATTTDRIVVKLAPAKAATSTAPRSDSPKKEESKKEEKKEGEVLKPASEIDTALPRVSITAPAEGEKVSRGVTLEAKAADNVGIVGVQFRVDGSNHGAEDMDAPYSVVWNSRLVSNGAHSISATARDAAGNTQTSALRKVIVSNATTSASAPTRTAVSGNSLLAASVVLSAAASVVVAPFEILTDIFTESFIVLGVR